MRAFQIKLNGKRICLAGIGKGGVLSTTITYTPSRRRQNTRLYVGGLLLPQDEHVKWKSVSLKVGDEVKLKVVEAAAVDKPSVRYPRNRAKRRLRELAKKFGWKSQTIPKHK